MIAATAVANTTRASPAGPAEVVFQSDSTEMVNVPQDAHMGAVMIKAQMIKATSVGNTSTNISAIERMAMVNTRAVALHGGPVNKFTTLCSLSAVADNSTYLRTGTGIGHLKA